MAILILATFPLIGKMQADVDPYTSKQKAQGHEMFNSSGQQLFKGQDEQMHICHSDFGSLLVPELFPEQIKVTNDRRRCKHKFLLGYLVKRSVSMAGFDEW